VKETPSEIISFGAWNRQRRQKLWHRSRQTRWTSRSVIERAREVLKDTSRASMNSAKRFPRRIRPREQNGISNPLHALDREVLEKLRDADLDQLKRSTPSIFSPSSKTDLVI